MTDRPDITNKLLNWWDEGHADMPWRQTADPYAIWVAEVMLQQTQIVTVIPYYERWLDRYPNIRELALSPLDEVLKMWEGLGYYSRARNLHAAAQLIVSDHGGCLPDEVETLRKLPGIGRYTAGAITSIAFGKPAPILDGNVMRVLSRLLDLENDISKTKTKNQLWKIAAKIVPVERPGAFNQALMELGQTVCLPAKPSCHVCPLNSDCLARARGTQLDRPVRPRRKKTPHYDVTAGVIRRDDGRFLIAQRPLNGLLGGLWEFPGGKQEADESLRDALRREIREELGIEIEVGPLLTTIKHAYTHFRITLFAFHARHRSGTPMNLEVADHSWVHIDELDRYAFAATDRKIIDQLQLEFDFYPKCGRAEIT